MCHWSRRIRFADTWRRWMIILAQTISRRPGLKLPGKPEPTMGTSWRRLRTPRVSSCISTGNCSRTRASRRPKDSARDQTIDYQQISDIASKDRWTWDQVVEAAKKLTKETDGKTEIWGFEFDQVSRLYQIQCLGESLGQPLLSPDGLKASGYLNSEKWIRAAQWYSDLFNKWKISPKNIAPDESPSLFSGGKVGIFVGGEWNVPRFKEAGVDFLVAPFPYFADGKPVTGTGSWHIGIAKSSQHKAEAAKFVKFLTASEQGSQIWFDSQGQA
jgi:hypothetical protein